MQQELIFKQVDLDWLGSMFSNRSLASPMNGNTQELFTEEDKNRLIEQGVIDQENQVSAAAYSLLDVLAKAGKRASIGLIRGPLAANADLYEDQGRLVSVVKQNEFMHASMPANPSRLLELVRGYWGSTSVTGCDLNVTLTPKEALLLLALADHYRLDSFGAMAREESFIYAGAKSEDLLSLCQNIRENSQSLRYHLVVLLAGIPDMDEKELKEVLESLEKKALLVREKAWIRPNRDALLLSGNFLVLENFLTLDIAQVQEESLYRSNALAIQAGPVDTLYMEHSSEGVLLECISADELTRLLGEVVAGPADIA